MLKKVYLEITNVCNLACSFCPGSKREKRFMSTDEFAVLAEKIRPYTDYLYFHLMGEPLMHPELCKLIKMAGDLGFKVIITTNGTLLDSAGQTLLASPAVHKVNISLQSFEANKGGELKSYILSCAAFAKRASEKGKICVLRLWNEGGLNAMNGEIKELLSVAFPEPWRESRQSLVLADRVFLESGNKFDWPDRSADELGESCFCYGLRDQVGVLCDGTVVPCCLDHEGDIALGNLLEDSLENIMSTRRACAIRDGFSKRLAVEELCRKCGYARRFS